MLMASWLIMAVIGYFSMLAARMLTIRGVHPFEPMVKMFHF